VSDRSLPVRGTSILLLLTAALLAFRLGAVPLLGPDEPRYARVAVEMDRAGEWVTPTLQGRPWLEKPVLYYWLAGAAYSLLGEIELAARLPSVLAAVVSVGLTALFGARIYGAGTGLAAGFALGTAVLPFAYGRAAAMDGLLACLVSAAIALIGLHVLGVAGRLAVPAGWACMGLATLAKGPLGVVLPGLVLLGWLLTAPRGPAARRVATPGSLLLFLLVASPWYAAIVLDQGWNFVDVFILDHNLLRFTSTLHAHPGPFGYYVPVLLLGLFPWSALLLPGFGALEPRREPADRLLLLWLLLPLAFFSSAGSKLPGYILPCLPPLALIIGRGATALVRGVALPRGLGSRAAARLGLLLAAALFGLALELVIGAAAGPRVFPRTLYGQPGLTALLPAALWVVVVAFLAARLIERRPDSALGMMRTGAAGFLLLLALAVPPLLGPLQSGRHLFLSANGRETVAWGAWRTAWMAGYFYNDARVRETETWWETREALEQGAPLVLCGPRECETLEQIRDDVETLRLAEGPRGNALLRVRLRAPAREPARASASAPGSRRPSETRTPPRP
jgi:4-amino-4-deoxy-L-arabinose transferase-like glycosyltransferase